MPVVESLERRITGSGHRLTAPRRALLQTLLGLGDRFTAEQVVEPLGLKESQRLLVSPDGALSRVAFALLCPGRDVVYVPSGTTYRLLSRERTPRGEGVLALGDADHGVGAGAKGLLSSGYSLRRLPETRKEANRVGDVVLLGKEASEGGLKRALAKRGRWRAVHFACHGLVDPERPLFSSLALTPDAGNDGLLTTLDVFRLRVPADLAVLSACDTAKGKVYRAEGVVGFTRAFMYAGAPRVIVSLWKVDDEATRALMVKFYELWSASAKATADKSAKATARLPTATALKKAQEFVRSHKKWEHPYYWAAWQLWGLPE